MNSLAGPIVTAKGGSTLELPEDEFLYDIYIKSANRYKG